MRRHAQGAQTSEEQERDLVGVVGAALGMDVRDEAARQAAAKKVEEAKELRKKRLEEKKKQLKDQQTQFTDKLKQEKEEFEEQLE